MSLDARESQSAAEVADRMNAMYRYQRHIYNVTRKFYLFGRDRLLKRLPAAAGASVLEIGCGTGRNLVKLARLAPQARLFGIDVSDEMLVTARRTLARKGLQERIRLGQAAAHLFDPKIAFGIESFDAAYFSYVLSMIPDWRGAVVQALSYLAPDGVLGVVDFCDQRDAPAWRRVPLLAWLRLFDVHPRPEIERSLPEFGQVLLHERVFDGYAYVMLLRKTNQIVRIPLS
jgi:S-adenosylmethionine-diacylgycerolhomoserine-N-methlytransferase